MGEHRQHRGVPADLPRGHLFRLPPGLSLCAGVFGEAPAAAGPAPGEPGLHLAHQAALHLGGLVLRRGGAAPGQGQAGGAGGAVPGGGVPVLPGGVPQLCPVGPGGFLLRGPCAVLGAAALPGALRACGAALWGVHRLQAPDAGVRPLIFVLRHQAAAVAETSAGHSPDSGGGAAAGAALYPGI